MDKPRKVELFSVPVHRDTAGQLIAYEAEPNLGIDLQRVFVEIQAPCEANMRTRASHKFWPAYEGRVE